MDSHATTLEAVLLSHRCRRIYSGDYGVGSFRLYRCPRHIVVYYSDGGDARIIIVRGKILVTKYYKTINTDDEHRVIDLLDALLGMEERRLEQRIGY